jgi:ribosome recycling factor
MSSIEEISSNTDAKMEKAVEALRKELGTIRTGRANPALVENIRVEYYGVPTPLNQVATISAPEARIIIIQPWDKQAVPNIEKAILKSNLGLNPVNAGNVIRLVIPELTEERREDLIKVVRKKIEEGKVAVRNVRRESANKLQKLKKEKEISEDEHRRTMNQLQKLTDSFIEKISQISEDKETELLEF